MPHNDFGVAFFELLLKHLQDSERSTDRFRLVVELSLRSDVPKRVVVLLPEQERQVDLLISHGDFHRVFSVKERIVGIVVGPATDRSVRFKSS
jgi:hypothetical protein